MALLLTENDVKTLLTMPLAMELVETSFRRLADGSATCHPRRRLRMATKGVMNYMAATDTAGGYMGLKIYTVASGHARFVVPLFSATSGDMLALIEADYLGQMRTGAATGVATHTLARADARTAGMIGTGLQSRTQLLAVSRARKLELVLAYSRDRARREKFATEMTARIGVPVKAVDSAEEAVHGLDIVTACTNSAQPVVLGRWLTSGAHVNAIGINFAEKREIDGEVVSRADVIAVDSLEQTKMEAGDLILAFGADTSRWNSVIEFSDIVSGKVPGRTNRDQITLFKSGGIAIEDVVVAGRVYEMARERGIGKDVPIWQDALSAEA